MQVLFGNIVSSNTLDLIVPISLMIIGIVIETRYIGRISMFTNALALFIFYHGKEMSSGLGIIVNIVIVLGLIGGISRFFRFSLPQQYYTIGWIGSSAVTAILLLAGL
ncbi:MAG: hypothetical protein ACP5OA_03120 [Candidatus Woesearchaeota archaeon]